MPCTSTFCWQTSTPLIAGLLIAFLAGCGGAADEPASEPQANASPPPGQQAPSASAEGSGPALTPEVLQERLKEKNPDYNGQGQFKFQNGRVVAAVLRDTGVRDLSPLSGLPLKGLDLYGNPVSDLSPLEDMPLEVLYLEDAPVKDISALQGLPLKVLYLNKTDVSDLTPLENMNSLQRLNLLETPATDLSPLANVPLRMLWLNDTPVRDVSPLADTPLVSLTLEGSQVQDLRPVGKMNQLQRLHIANTPVTDLTPLEGLQLTRLVFSPGQIEQGMDVVRNMDSLQKIGTQFGSQENDLRNPVQFWQQYDQGN